MSKEAVHGLSVCENCNKSTNVIYKCYIDDSLCPPWVPNVIHKCYKCAFNSTND
jgi:hypothetical protein